MNYINKVVAWGDSHHPKALDYFRISLGIILMWKGIEFWLHLNAFSKLMQSSTLGFAASISLIAHLIIVFHIIGGLLIALGTYTRVFCLLNLPILVTAVLFINPNPEFLKPYAEFWLSLVVLLGLVCFLIEGNGKISVEHQKEQRG
jgi:putative oxidoreductase